MSQVFSAIQIVRADERDLPGLADLIARAFLPLPASRWLIPDELERREIFPRYFPIPVEQARRNGRVDTTSDLDGVALWLPIAAGPEQIDPGYERRLADSTGRHAERFRAFDRTLAAHHPTGPDHEYLAILAVDPGRQGRGVGTALLRARHKDLDEQGRAAYLVAAGPRSAALYLRHGYDLVPGDPLRLPDGGPEMFRMLRPPHPGRST
jgi:GNAT superfamily N-acetyltransferase